MLQALYAIRDPHWVWAAIVISEFGEWYTTAGLALALALLLALRERFALAQGLLLSVVTSALGTFFLKSIIARPRPPVHFWAYTEYWYSFPSAHAAMSLALYGFMAYIALRLGTKRTSRIALAAATLLVLCIGFTRLYLGVHYPSDILGGYLLGAACVWLGIWTEQILSRGKISL